MQKNNVKSFICSFLFSILAVFAVQKLFLHTPEIKNEPKETLKPQKISLFTENSILSKQETIALKPSADIDVSQIADLTAPKDEIKIAKDTSLQPVEDSLLYNEPQKPTVETDLAMASEITLSDEEHHEIEENQKHLQSGIVYADISDTFETSDQTSLALADQEEIPLFENNVALYDKVSITSSSSNASQIAMVEPQALINTIEEPDILQEEKNIAEADIKKSELGEIFDISQATIDESAWDVATAAQENVETDSADNAESETQISSDQDNPWVMAKGNKYAKNQAAVEAFATVDETETQPAEDQPQAQTPIFQEESSVEQTFIQPLLKEKDTNKKLAYQMIQNILIPIPDDILNDSDLTPDLSNDVANADKKTTVANKKPELNEDEKQSGLFKSISSWLGKNKDTDTKDQASLKGKKGKDGENSLVNTVKGKVFSALGSVEDYQKTNGTNIMPAELRLSFQPNRAEISGQTLRWIYAFADNARDNDDVYIEVRIDGTSSYALQQKRLNLLSSIFSSRGVDYRKINTIFTSREPNSFIIRNIRFNNEKGDANK